MDPDSWNEFLRHWGFQQNG